MAGAEKQLDAAQKFLRGILSLASYGEVQSKQALGVAKALERVPSLSAAQAAAYLGVLQTDWRGFVPSWPRKLVRWRQKAFVLLPRKISFCW